MAKQIRALPIAPDSTNPATFNTRADAFVRAMQPFADDANALAKELEELSANVDTKSGDTDTKYADLVQKYADFITKYGDFFAKYDIFVPAYLDIKSKHGEVRTNKEHVDEVKKQIDAALKKATDMINEGGIIDDTKTTLVTTYSSKKIQEQIDRIDADVAKKADDETAYKEWNYKEISDDFTAQNNDALFVNTTKPITITLPNEGKVKIVDIAGNFFQKNVTVKTDDATQTFRLDRDYQRVEFVKFGGKWQISSGYLPQGTEFFRVTSSVSMEVDLGGDWVLPHKDLIFTSGGIFDTKAMTKKSISTPVVASAQRTKLIARGNKILYLAVANNALHVFSLDKDAMAWTQILKETVKYYTELSTTPDVFCFSDGSGGFYIYEDGLKKINIPNSGMPQVRCLKNCYVFFGGANNILITTDKNGVVKLNLMHAPISVMWKGNRQVVRYQDGNTHPAKYYEINENEDGFVEISQQEYTEINYEYEKQILGQILKINQKEQKATLSTPQGEQKLSSVIGYSNEPKFLALTSQYMFFHSSRKIKYVGVEYINTKKEI